MARGTSPPGLDLSGQSRAPNFLVYPVPLRNVRRPIRPHAAMPADSTSIKRRVSRFNGGIHVRSDCYRWQAAQGHRRRIPAVENLDVATGEAIDFDRVLLVANGEDVKIGLPAVEGAKVTAEVVSTAVTTRSASSSSAVEHHDEASGPPPVVH